MPIKVSNKAGVQVLSLEGELVSGTAQQFRNEIERLLARDERDYVIACHSLTSIDSSGLEALTWLRARTEERLGMVKLAGVGDNLATILRMTRLDDHYEQFAKTEEAVASFG